MSARPLITAFIASRLQPGHRERVLRGTPAATRIRSLLLGNGPGAQRGCGILPCGKAELIRLEKFQAAFEAARKTLAVKADIGSHLRREIQKGRNGLKLRQHGSCDEGG